MSNEARWTVSDIVLSVWLFTMLAVALVEMISGCEPYPPSPPDEPVAGCPELCPVLRANGCKRGDEACDADGGFDDAGECVRYLTCEEDCARNPRAYPKPACVLGLDAGDICSAADERCF